MTYRWLIPIGLTLLWPTPAVAKDIALTFDSPSAKTATTTTRTSTANLSFTPKPRAQPTDAAPAPVKPSSTP